MEYLKPPGSRSNARSASSSPRATDLGQFVPPSRSTNGRIRVFVRERPRVFEDDVDDAEYVRTTAVASAASSTPEPARIPTHDFLLVDAAERFVQVQRHESETPRRFHCDGCFTEADGHLAVYEQAVAPIVRDVCNGLNGMVMLYGQPGSGKSYTIFDGCDVGLQHQPGQARGQGLLVQAVHDLFDTLNGTTTVFSVSVSML